MHTDVIGKSWKLTNATCNFFLGEEVKVARSCPTPCDPMDCIVRGVLQARILEWVAFPSSRGSSQPRDRTQVSHTAGGFFTLGASLIVQLVKNPPAMQDTLVRILDQEEPLEMG